MKRMNPKVDAYLADGCGRCSLYKTPQCKVHTWSKELKALRKIMLNSGLVEEVKWSQPCYTLDNGNVAMMSAFKDYAFISIFKGTLLKDPKKILVSPGENSQAARQLRFTNIAQIKELEPVIDSYIREAIEIEKAGLKVDFKKHSDYEIPEELEKKFQQDPELKKAFDALTPGRQRGYYLHFSTPKQSRTRESRIEKCRQRIFDGKGFNER
jgi:uncharacterized protein YdeI (YjbR/CyaY-like superfamily)